MLLSETKISNDCSTLVEKDVCKFEIAVKEPTFCNFNISTNYIFSQLDGFFFLKFAFLLKKNAEISFVTIFGDDVAMRSFSYYIKTFKNIAMLQLSENFDLTIKHFSTCCISNSPHLNSFNSNCFIWMICGLLVCSFLPL